jgi:hypothetical protein
MAKYVTISVTPKSKIIIDRLAGKYEMSQKDFTEAMASYFDETGTNPKDIQVLSVAEELKKYRDTIISFIRKQEKDFILPTFGTMNTLMVRFKDYLDNEAPRRGDASSEGRGKAPSLNLAELTGKPADEKVTEAPTGQQGSEADFQQLKKDYEKLELRFNTTKHYLENILSNTSEKSTGLNRKPVIELSMADINDYRAFLKKL